MLTSESIKQRAYELGAAVCGIGAVYEESNPQRDPYSILPKAKCIIGFGFPVPKGLYKAMDLGNQYYTYASIGVKYVDEEMAEIFLLKMGAMIEDAGYDACLQKAIPNLRIKGDKTTNPEVKDTYELIHAVPVAPGKPVPDVIIDFGKAAKACRYHTHHARIKKCQHKGCQRRHKRINEKARKGIASRYVKVLCRCYHYLGGIYAPCVHKTLLAVKAAPYRVGITFHFIISSTCFQLYILFNHAFRCNCSSNPSLPPGGRWHERSE